MLKRNNGLTKTLDGFWKWMVKGCHKYVCQWFNNHNQRFSIPLVIKTINHLTRLYIVHSAGWLPMPFHFINSAKWSQFLPLSSFCWHGYHWPMAKFGYKLPKIKTLIKNMYWSIRKTLIRDMNWSIFDTIPLNVHFIIQNPL